MKSHHWITKNNCADCVQHHFSSHFNVLLKLVQHFLKGGGGGGGFLNYTYSNEQ